MDELCLYDIPDSIDYILSVTRRTSLSYIGFSQGTAQAFASLSIHPQLNQRVDMMIALAPAMSPPGLAQPIVDTMMKASPALVFLFFGRRAILSSAVMWQAILYNPIYNSVIDGGLRTLFNWHCKNISSHQKVAAYSHLYSFTSVKAVVHWFQIMRRGELLNSICRGCAYGCPQASFQMYDDDVRAALYSRSFYHPAPFPTQNISTPITLLYGTEDSLVDIDVMLNQLPNHTGAVPIANHEHVDILWGRDVNLLVFPKVLEILKSESHAVSDVDRSEVCTSID
jgi:lysosomal acid lipase/cholesteryl ester hydrolase